MSLKVDQTPHNWAHRSVILLLVLLGSLAMLSSSSVVDTARDVFNAWQIANGNNYPLEGPMLAWVMHSGPIWFYVLALPLFFSSSWVLLSFWVGLLTGLKYLLAYACGARLGSRNFGLIWACLLALPNWSAINYLIFSHTNLVESLMLFGFYSLIRWQQGEPRWFVGLCLAVSLAFHAHPTTIAFGIAVVPLVLKELWQGRLSWRLLLVGIIVALLPWLPYLLNQQAQQWPDMHSSNTYMGTLSYCQNFLGVLDLARGTLVDAPLIMLRGFFGLQGWVLWLLYGFIAVIFTAGLALAAWYSWARRQWQVPAALLFMTLLSLGLVALLRNITQYYLVLLVYPSFCGLVAWGWAQCAEVWVRRISLLASTAALITLLAFSVSNYWMSRSGHAPIPQQSLLNVRSHATDAFTDGVIFPAWARSELAGFICGHNDAVIFHGYASLVLEQSYALEAHMRCPQQEIFQGGQGAGQHYLAVSRHDAELLGFESELQVGPMLFFTPTQVFGPENRVAFPTGEVYPPRLPMYGTARTLQRDIVTSAQEWLVVTNLFLFWMPAEIELSLNGQPVAAVLETSVQSYYHCETCQAGDTANWTISIQAENPEFVETVSFEPDLAVEQAKN